MDKENKFRNTVKTLIIALFKSDNIEHYKELAIKFELELYLLYIKIGFNEYIKQVIKLSNIYYNNINISEKYEKGILSIEDIYIKYNPHNERNIIKKQFMDVLIKNKYNKKQAIIDAKKIERSCYNSVIHVCKSSSINTCRQWENTTFKQIYSNKCGLIYNLIDKNSTTCKTYGNIVMQKILNNEVNLDVIGFYSERDLMPQASQKEYDILLQRSNQKINEKESNLFKCPSCGIRKCTYVEVQLRSIDEPPDYICKCINCSRNFKGTH